MLDQLSDPRTWLLVLVISIVGVISKSIYYFIGREGKDKALEKTDKISPERWDELAERYEKGGSKTLIFGSIPVVGPVLAAIAGAFHTNFLLLVFWVMLSGIIRNWILVLVFNATLSLLPFTS
jgi:membrane protein DedA with SNARE-associated domain